MKLGSIRLRTLPVVVKQIVKSQTLVILWFLFLWWTIIVSGRLLYHNVSGRFQTVIANMRNYKIHSDRNNNNVTNPFLAHKPFFEKSNTT